MGHHHRDCAGHAGIWACMQPEHACLADCRSPDWALTRGVHHFMADATDEQAARRQQVHGNVCPLGVRVKEMISKTNRR